MDNPEQYQLVIRTGLKPARSEFQVPLPNHSATLTSLSTLTKELNNEYCCEHLGSTTCLSLLTPLSLYSIT